MILHLDPTRKSHKWPVTTQLLRLAFPLIWSIPNQLPRQLSFVKRGVLRFFGAKISPNTVLGRSVEISMPWNLTMEDGAAIGEYVFIYNFAPVTIGGKASISRGSVICTASHDYTDQRHPLTTAPISIGSLAWLAMDVFVCPGVTIGEGAVIGSRSVVTKDMPEWMICAGNPCKPIKPRVIKPASSDE